MHSEAGGSLALSVDESNYGRSRSDTAPCRDLQSTCSKDLPWAGCARNWRMRRSQQGDPAAAGNRATYAQGYPLRRRRQDGPPSAMSGGQTAG